MEKIGRNEACHCGSGKKYKNCHQQADAEKGGRNKNLMIGGLLAFFIIVSAILLFMNTQSSGNAAPGEAPAGKVWSEEHGHWHEAE